jgi:hypothetical protein
MYRGLIVNEQLQDQELHPHLTTSGFFIVRESPLSHVTLSSHPCCITCHVISEFFPVFGGAITAY